MEVGTKYYKADMPSEVIPWHDVWLRDWSVKWQCLKRCLRGRI
jgi:hypothetical protein